MSTIRIVTDSTADLPMDLVNEFNISVVPLRVRFGEEIYREGVDLSITEFNKKLIENDNLPSTSQPSPGEFVTVYENLAAEGVDQIISIHLSNKFSGTYQSALLASSMVSNKVQVEVIDSQLVNMALGLIVLRVARAIKEGKNLQEIKILINQLINKMNTFFVVDTLDYLQKGGRIGKASFLVGSLLNIKPILTLSEGEVHGYERVRGRKGKAFERLIEIALSKVPENSKIQCAITHCNSLDKALVLREKVLNTFNCSEVIVSDIGAVVGTYVGPGTVALIFYVL